MTLDKRRLRHLFDEWLSDYGVNDRFEVDIQGSCFILDHVDGKRRIQHEEQSEL